MSSEPFSIVWERLGWRPLPGHAAPDPSEGRIALAVVAPWCPDCLEAGHRLLDEAPPGRKCWLVGEFTGAAELQAFAGAFHLPWPNLLGQREKSEESRQQARFRGIREAWGDTRHWGLPLWIEGELRNGFLFVGSVRWPE